MVGMFDAGLRAAALGGNYDKARAFANQQLDIAKSLSYSEVRDNFPVASSTPNPTYETSPALNVPPDVGLPAGATYTVTKRYLSSDTSTANFSNASSDQGVMRVVITVNWSGSSYTVTGLKAR